MTTAVSDLSNLSDRFGSVDEDSLCPPLVVSAATLETKRAAADALAVVMNRRREELSVSLVSISLLAVSPVQSAEAARCAERMNKEIVARHCPAAYQVFLLALDIE